MTGTTTSKKSRASKSYEDRTGLSTRAAKILIAATFTKPETTTDENGNVIRVWKSSEMSSYSNADIASCLVNKVAVEPNEMLGTVPPSAIKYAVTRGWLLPNSSKTLYRVTLKGAIDLNLPMHFRGKLNGRKIPFVRCSERPPMQIKTASWFTSLPADHTRIGISRSVPHRLQTPGYRIFRKLAPGPWFNTASLEEYNDRFEAEVLDRLDPSDVAARLVDLAAGGIPVMVCYERPRAGQWCHRALVAKWLAEALGEPVPEFGFEALAQDDHPLWPAGLRPKNLTGRV